VTSLNRGESSAALQKIRSLWTFTLYSLQHLLVVSLVANVPKNISYKRSHDKMQSRGKLMTDSAPSTVYIYTLYIRSVTVFL
jgi:hypothetical protein